MKGMKYYAKIILAALTVALTSLSAKAQIEILTVRKMMDKAEETYKVSFVYDSSLSVGQPYFGKSVDGMKLTEAMDRIFHDTGILWKRQGKYIVLTPAEPEIISSDIPEEVPERNDTLTEARITGETVHYINRTQTGLKHIDGKKFNRGFAFMSSPDLIKTLQQLPGVSTGTELVSGLYVHGGTGSDNLFLLDGVPMYQVSHLAGLFSSFNTDIVESVDFYKSGFPARYGGRLSSVVDVRTKDGDFYDYSGVFSIGLTEGRIQYGGPIVRGKTSFNVALRRSWLDIVTTPVMAIINARNKGKEDKKGFNYAMWDLNGKITHKFKDDSKMSFNIYYGRDAFKIRTVGEFVSSISSDGVSYMSRDTSSIKTGWGNLLGSVNWEKHITDKLSTEMSVYYSMYNSNFRITESKEYEDQNEVEISRYSESFRTIVSDAGFKADFDWRLSKVNHLRFGAIGKYHFFFPKSSEWDTRILGSEIKSHNNISDRARYSGYEASVYLEDEIHIVKWMDANLGLRYVMMGSENKTRHALEPRAALNFRFSKTASMKFSYSEMNQFSHQVTTVNLDLPVSTWLPSTARIAPMHSRQVAGGIYLDLPHNIRLNVEGYWKTMDHLREYGKANALCPPLHQWEYDFREGKGKAYGAEVEAGWNTERLDLSVYYTISWSKRKFDDFSRGWFLDRNDSRHKFTVNFSYKFSEKIDAYAAWNYSTGIRMTLPTYRTEYEGENGFNQGYNGSYLLYVEPNNVKLPDYHRLDVGINFRKTTKRGNERIWNLSVYNVYSRMNPIMAEVMEVTDSGDSRTFVASALGVVPIIPSFSYILKF